MANDLLKILGLNLSPEEVEKRLMKFVDKPAGGKVLRTAMRVKERVFWIELVGGTNEEADEA